VVVALGTIARDMRDMVSSKTGGTPPKLLSADQSRKPKEVASLEGETLQFALVPTDGLKP